jgi:hypothetical protein
MRLKKRFRMDMLMDPAGTTIDGDYPNGRPA